MGETEREDKLCVVCVVSGEKGGSGAGGKKYGVH